LLENTALDARSITEKSLEMDQRLAVPGAQSPSSSGAWMNTGTMRCAGLSAYVSAALSASRKSRRNQTSAVVMACLALRDAVNDPQYAQNSQTSPDDNRVHAAAG
jgi:hypothetical protein